MAVNGPGRGALSLGTREVARFAPPPPSVQSQHDPSVSIGWAQRQPLESLKVHGCEVTTDLSSHP